MSQIHDPEVIRSHLSKVCKSAELRRSRQIVRFLTFLVEHSLSGSAESLNERVIAERVFERTEEWDPSLDTIVRTETRRLRGKLDAYYEGEGKEEPIRILLPRGGYFVEFESTRPAVMDESPIVPREPKRGIRWFVPAAAVLIVGIVLVAWLWRRREHSRTPALFGQPFAFAVGEEFSPAISPDGRMIAYVWDGDDDNFDIYIRAIDGGATTRLTTGPQAELYPAFSPDGKRLAYLRVEEEHVNVVIRELDSGQERILAQIRREIGRWAENLSPLLGNPGPAWSGDSQSVIVSDAPAQSPNANGLYRISLATGLREQITQTPGEARDFFPKVSPDGQWLAFVRYFTHGMGEVFVLPATSGANQQTSSRQLTHDGKLINGLAWRPDNQSLVFSSNRAGPLQIWQLTVSQQMPELLPVNAASTAEPAISRDGSLLVYVDSSENWNIWRASLQDHQISGVKRLLASSGINKAPAYSPDGQHIAFLSDRSGTMEVWIADADGSSPSKLSGFNEGYLGGIGWSPDGKRLVVDARIHGNSQIVILDVSDGKRTLLEANNYEERSPSWMPEGQGIYYNSNRSGEVEVWSRELLSREPRKIAGQPFFATHTLPHGNTLFLSDTTGNLYSAKLDGTGLSVLPGAPRARPVSSWSICSDGLFFSVDDDQQVSAALWFEPNGKTAIQIGTTNAHLGVNSPDLAVAPDCHSLLYTQQDHIASDIKLVANFSKNTSH